MAPRSKKKLSAEEIRQSEEERKNAPEEDVTHFEEDDNPRTLVGERIEDKGDENE